MSRFTLILPAAGRSVRYGAGTSKLLENLAGIPVIARAIRPFLQRTDLAKIIIPCTEPDELAASVHQGPEFLISSLRRHVGRWLHPGRKLARPASVDAVGLG